MRGRDDGEAARRRLIDEIDVDAITCLPLVRLLAYWRNRYSDGRLPARKDIDPLDIPFVLGNLLLVEVIGDPPRFRYRLAGSTLTERFGFDPTGQFVDDHPDPTFRAIALEVYGEIAAHPRPFVARRNAVMDNRLRHYETLVLPLAADHVHTDMFVVCTWFLD